MIGLDAADLVAIAAEVLSCDTGTALAQSIELHVSLGGV